VYAVWTVNEGVDRTRVGDWLRASLGSGLSHLDEIVADSAGAHGQDRASVMSYLRDNLHFVLGERDLQGVEAFQKLCLRYNLIPASAGSRPLVAAHH
jgi:hypothetical protein